jgi:hypothetical protein
MAITGKNRIMIYGSKSDGTYVVEFRTAAGEALAISIPRTEAAVIRHFQERMPLDSSFPTFREEYLPRQRVFPDGFPHLKSSPREGSRDPARANCPWTATHSGGVLVCGPACGRVRE